MLMLGESIPSLVTLEHAGSIEPGDHRYTLAFYSGIVTVTLFQYLFFRTQPVHAKDHVLRRRQSGAFLFFYAHIFYSASLILSTK